MKQVLGIGHVRTNTQVRPIKLTLRSWRIIYVLGGSTPFTAKVAKSFVKFAKIETQLLLRVSESRAELIRAMPSVSKMLE